MDHLHIINELDRNRTVFESLLSGLKQEEYLWKPSEDKWCLLEVLCHLYDEEREDFKERLNHVLQYPGQPFKPIDPEGWVKARRYQNQGFELMLTRWIMEREGSVAWLRSLQEPVWENAFVHPKFGKMTGNYFLANWLQHDYLHIRQIVRLKYQYLAFQSGQDLSYAGKW
jgi:hypothetical protein